jgi:hypothetical protein
MYCKLSNSKCIKTNDINENDTEHCMFNTLTKRCRKIKEKTSVSSSSSSVSVFNFDMEIQNRKMELEKNNIFNNTNFVVDPDTFEISSPSLKNMDVVCSSNQEEFFRNCFVQMGSGSFGVFYSPVINKKFGIRKLIISNNNQDALDNELSLLRFFRQKYEQFPFVVHMYGWMDYDNVRYIILEHKDKDLETLLLDLSSKNDDITNIFINIYKILVVQLKYFSFEDYDIYHQDLHCGNVLIKEYDEPIHIKWWYGLDIYTKYVPYIHDFDLSGTRSGKTIINNIRNGYTILNDSWENLFQLPDIRVNPNYYEYCYDTYQIFNSMVHNTIHANIIDYTISIDLVEIFHTLFNKKIKNNNFKKYINISLKNISNKNKIYKKNTNIEYKLNFVKSYLNHPKLVYKTPILHYSQLNPLYENIDDICELYDVDNINI